MNDQLIQFESRDMMQRFLQEMSVVTPAQDGVDYLDDELGNDLVTTFAKPQVEFHSAYEAMLDHVCRRYEPSDREIIARALRPICAHVHSHLQWLMQTPGVNVTYHSWNGLCLRVMVHQSNVKI